MLTVDDLKTLEVGDLLEVPGPFQGMSREPIRLSVAEADPSAGRVRLTGTYFGVRLGD